jgi:hypothetical protein
MMVCVRAPFSASWVPRVWRNRCAWRAGLPSPLRIASSSQIWASGAGEQVVGVGQDAVAQEQVAHRASQVGIEDPVIRLGFAQLHQVTDRLRGLFVHGHGAFPQCLAGRQAQPVGLDYSICLAGGVFRAEIISE